MKTYIVTVRLTVEDEHVDTIESVADEVTSWLEGLYAEVDSVTVAEEEHS
jgi:dihydroneopterin aldolase